MFSSSDCCKCCFNWKLYIFQIRIHGILWSYEIGIIPFLSLKTLILFLVVAPMLWFYSIFRKNNNKTLLIKVIYKPHLCWLSPVPYFIYYFKKWKSIKLQIQMTHYKTKAPLLLFKGFLTDKLFGTNTIFNVCRYQLGHPNFWCCKPYHESKWQRAPLLAWNDKSHGKTT